MPRGPLKHLPLVEYIFDIRWSNKNGKQGLYDDYILNVGRLYEKLKNNGYKEPITFQSVPKEIFTMIDAPPPITHQFFKGTEPHPVNGLFYPLVQFGPGIASLNIDKRNYNWRDLVRPEIINLYNSLSELHNNFSSNINHISLRSLDFFEAENYQEALLNKFKISISTPFKNLGKFDTADEKFTFSANYKIKNFSTTLDISISPSIIGANKGLILNIYAQTSRPTLESNSIDILIDYLHELTGDSFFALLTEEHHVKLQG